LEFAFSRSSYQCVDPTGIVGLQLNFPESQALRGRISEVF